MPISTYAAVPTLAVGDKLTAARFNSIATALNFLLNPPEVNATNTAGTSIPNNVLTLVPFASETKDTGPTWDGAMHDNVTNNSRVVATTAGTYRVEARIAFAANATGRRAISVRLNSGGSGSGGTQQFAIGIANPGAGDLAVCKDAIEVSLAANDYIEVFAIQSSGGALTLDSSTNANFLNLRLLGS